MHKQERQKGTTLLELLVALSIVALIMGGVVALIFQEYRGTNLAKTYVTAAHEIRRAARWISQDMMMAESTDLIEGTESTDNVTLNWIERYDFTDLPHSCSYYLLDDQLQRNYDGTITTVAQNISMVDFSQTGRLVTVSISCTPRWWNPNNTVEKTYRIYLRPTEEG